MKKLTAGEKLRRQAIERTRLHIEAQSKKGTLLRRVLQVRCDNLDPAEYIAMEQKRLEQLEAGL